MSIQFDVIDIKLINKLTKLKLLISLIAILISSPFGFKLGVHVGAARRTSGGLPAAGLLRGAFPHGRRPSECRTRY